MSEHTSDEQHDDARWEALARFLAGESTPDEADAVRRDLLERPADAELLAALQQAALQDPGSLRTGGAVDVEAALKRVKARIAAEPSIRTRSITARPAFGGRERTWFTPALAAAVVVIALGAMLFSRRNHPVQPAASQVALGRTYTTPVGGRDSVLLADGTRVLLGPGTTLAVGARYGTTDREVAVTGEAYFDVRHDEAHPFVVHAGLAQVRDVGTAFTVHDDVSGDVRVAVTTGTVRLQAGVSDSGVLLRGGDAGIVTSGARAAAHAGGATAADLAWTHGQLVFREATLDDVAADLHRWYGIELRVTDTALARRHLTATFSGDSARRVIQVIALAIGGDASWHGDTAVIRR